MLHKVREHIGPAVRHHPRLKSLFIGIENKIERARHAVRGAFPSTIRPHPFKIMIAITAQCNARCVGCRYGRDFMVGEQLSFEMVRDLLDDAKEAGFYSIRLYGGEPTLHKDLTRMVAHCRDIGLRPYLTTNAATLDRVAEPLFDAGLRDISVGFYGVGQEYDDYVQRPGFFAKVENGIRSARERYGDALDIQMNWLLMRPRANPTSLHAAWDFANRYHMPMRIDLVHYSLPYFQEGPERELQFRPEDRETLAQITEQLIEFKGVKPDMINHDLPGLRSIPDWLIKGPAMKVPCTASEMIWVGADGTVQLCYVCFKLGNLHDTRLRDILFTDEHRQSARDSFLVNCPNCHCSSNERIMRHGPSRRAYSK